MVVGHPEDALDRAKRAKNFYALDMGRLVVALRRYREVDHRYFGHSPQLPKVGPYTKQLLCKCAKHALKLRFKGADIERVRGLISCRRPGLSQLFRSSESAILVWPLQTIQTRRWTFLLPTLNNMIDLCLILCVAKA